MALAPGARLGPYQVTAQIGAGGMGEVYAATDTNLGRQVAIKILPEAFAADAERLARFEREARTLASLNHPNIAIIHGFEKADGVRALVMELVDGPTLADRIAQGPIPIDEALPIAKQIVEALEAAHEQSIVHRDLKPANIKVRSDETVKVLDFGLAKALEPVGAMSVSASMSPTITTPAMTQAGMILGTAAYMSPEQARGGTVDKRVDLWAFGVVLWEMLTGNRLFEGATVSDTLAAVLKTEPQWNALTPETPPAIRRLLRRCLEKDRKRRLDSAADARLEIEDALTASIPDAAFATNERSSWRWITQAFLALGVVGLAIPAVRHLREVPAQREPETRTEIVTPPTTDPFSLALSRDGRQLVFVASGNETSRLWLRSLATTTAQPLAGTEGASTPFWSPDGRSIGFFAEGKLKRLEISSGAAQVLTTAVPRGGAWNSDGAMLFAATTGSAIFRMPASGGEAVAVTTLEAGESSHRWPTFLTDGRHFLYYAMGPPEKAGIYLASLDAESRTRLTTADTGGFYSPAGWLLWVRGGTLVAQRLDLSRRALVGDVVTLADTVGVDTATFAAAFSVSANSVAYRPAGAGRRQLRWFNRAGKEVGVLGSPDDAGLSFPRVSLDGRRALVSRVVQGNWDVWLLDGTRTIRETFDAALERLPLWSPDGTRLVFDSTRKGSRDLYLGSVTSPGTETVLLESTQDKVASDWSPDQRFLLYGNRDPQTDWDLWVLPLAGDRNPCLFLKTNFGERVAQFSPDGRWVAYLSNQSGPTEVFVRPFVQPPAAAQDCTTTGSPVKQWQISTAGGIYPRWGADGKEIFYIGPNGHVMAAPITASAESLEVGMPVALFQTRIFGGGADNQQGWQYDVSRDGRFLINTVLEDGTGPITLLQNWSPPGER